MTTLWWIADIVLLVVVIPVVLYLLNGVLSAAKSIVPSVRADRERGGSRGRRTSTRRPCCSRRRIRWPRRSRESPSTAARST